MKYYVRFILCAVLCGFVFFGTGFTGKDSVYLSDIAVLLGFGEIECIPTYVINIIYSFAPMLMFQILYGTYIYRHFCCATVYFFSRMKNKILWYIKESLTLAVFSLLYELVFFVSSVMASFIFNRVLFNFEGIILCMYLLVVHVLFIFATTNIINILSILFGSSISFVIVNGIQILSMALFTMADIFFSEGQIMEKHFYILFNPIAHLVLKVHSSNNEKLSKCYSIIGKGFDFNISIMAYLILAIASLVMGCFIVKTKDVISEAEQEGI